MKIEVVAALLLGMASLADAHFVWVVPDANGTSGKVLMNETLSPTAEVDVAIIGGSKLSVRSADGRETLLILKKAAEFLSSKGTIARYTVEQEQPHRLDTLAGANAARLFEGLQQTKKGCTN